MLLDGELKFFSLLQIRFNHSVVPFFPEWRVEDGEGTRAPSNLSCICWPIVCVLTFVRLQCPTLVHYITHSSAQESVRSTDTHKQKIPETNYARWHSKCNWTKMCWVWKRIIRERTILLYRKTDTVPVLFNYSSRWFCFWQRTAWFFSCFSVCYLGPFFAHWLAHTRSLVVT